MQIENFQLKTLSLEGSPSGVAASLELEATLRGKVSGPGGSVLEASKDLFSAAIPGAGINVPHIFQLGALLNFGVAASTSVSGVGNFTFGIGATVPNDARVTIDGLNPEQSSQTGFDGATFDPSFNVNQLDGNVTVAVSAQPKLTFGVEVIKVGKLEASLLLSLPKISATVGGIFGT